jgi:hypothetical protein
MTYHERCDHVIRFFAERGPEGYVNYTGLMEIAAKLFLGNEDEDSSNDLRAILANPHGDMFWMIPVMLVTLVGHDRLPADIQEMLKSNWSEYTPYRGDTENHWLMYYAAMLLAAEFYPDEPESFWFNGRSSEENRIEATEYLDYWFGLVSTIGQIEFDSPHYIAMFISPLALLRRWAQDERMRRRAEMMLNLVIAGFAAESVDGLLGGAHSRIYPEPLMERWKNPSTTLSYLLFGNVPFEPTGINCVLPRIGYRPHATAMIVAMSGYEPSSVMHAIGTDRSEPYVHRELHRVRHRIRFADTWLSPVAKQSYVCKDFVLGSVQGGLIQPIQQHSWELMWATDDPHEGFNILMNIHPYASEHELGMFFPEEPELMEHSVVNEVKPTYPQPDKWTGGSPFEHIAQHKNSLIVLYDIPEGTRYSHVSGFFSRALEDFEEHQSGWIFCRGNRCLIAYLPLAAYEWRPEGDGDRRMHSTILKNGSILHAASLEEYGSMDSFKETILGCEWSFDMTGKPAASFRSPAGDLMEFEFGIPPSINGEQISYEDWPVMEGKFARNPEPGVVELVAHGEVQVLDFNRL